MADNLKTFSTPVREWFADTFGEPTPPQAQGWPAIQRGDHSLILAPTGSGKTLAAFLSGIDNLYIELSNQPTDQPTNESGVRLLYISPLKALNNDIRCNLRQPLAGIGKKAHELGIDFPQIKVSVRSGDTPQRDRRAMVKSPPHILITTPESLYLILTSPQAREMFRTVRTVIVDEIHTLAGNKRGVHLSLSLERLQHIADNPVQRIGLSATIQPLDEVARFLGGNQWSAGGHSDSRGELAPRPVTVIDAAYDKPMDLQVETVVDDFHDPPGKSVWTVIVPRVLDLIQEHDTTLIFANNRRLAERTADRLNEQIAAEEAGQASGLIEDGVAKGTGFLAAGTGRDGPIRAHHGSMSREARLQMERDLKAGSLPALVGTSSLELGIDMGSIDLVIQLESPKSVAQGLQRVGRSGHLVGQTSTGRIFPTHREDVMEAAAIAGGMLHGDVEPTYTPRHPLDVLAQQIVAMVSVETWEVEPAYHLVRQAYAYENLSWKAFTTVLEMLAGRYPSQAHRELRPRLAWDRVNNKLADLPRSRMLALTNGGTIPDRGQFSAYLADGKTRIGELDEEFVYETRVGDVFTLGSQVWRVVDITDDKVMVSEAPGALPRMPFWRGDYPWRPYELGQRVGAFRREVAGRLRELQTEIRLTGFQELEQNADHPQVAALLDWLREGFALDQNSAWHVVRYVLRQLEVAGTISSDETILVEVFDDALGDPRMVVHSPFGGRVNGPWGLALAGALRERTGVKVEVQTNDDGILLRFPDADAEFPLDIVAEIGPAEARQRILRELPDSAVFGAQFRQNAARALLLPGRRGRRTPFWLQRLRAKDLLQVVRQFDDFPIVAETYRDCLQDVMDLPHLEEVLGRIKAGGIQVVPVESYAPSPVAKSLLWDFISVYMYEWDAPKAERQLQTLSVNRDLLQDLLQDVALDELLRPEAIEAVAGHLRHTAPTARARTVEELAVAFQQLGDLTAAEIGARTTVDPADWIEQLAAEKRIVEMEIPTAADTERRWIAAEYAAEYATLAATDDLEAGALAGSGSDDATDQAAWHDILQRFLRQAGPVTVADVRQRYAFPEPWLYHELQRLVEAGELAQGRFSPRTETAREMAPTADAVYEYVDRHALEQIHRRTLGILRREVQPVGFAQYADFLTRWQHVHPDERLAGAGALTRVLQQLRVAPGVGQTWERDVLPLRLARFGPAELDALAEGGELVWVGSGGVDPRRGRIRFLFRGEGNVYLQAPPEDLAHLSDDARLVYKFLKSEGAVFYPDLRDGLDLTKEALESALVELVMESLATNDSLDALRQMVRAGAVIAERDDDREPWSSLEAQLAERMADRQRRRGVGRPDPAAYRAAQRRVRERLERREPALGTPPAPTWPGRWTLVHSFRVMGKDVALEERMARQARQLLQRHGVVTRDSLAREEGAWSWPLIYHQLRLMEMRGEVRRGYFVQGLPGVQFALPEVVERLRELRDITSDDETLVVLNATDPANLYGSVDAPAPSTAAGEVLTFARLPSTWLVQHRGVPVLVAESSCVRITTAAGTAEDVLRRALEALLDHLSRFEHRVTVETWNGEPILESEARALLESLGFYRDYPGMTWERRS